MNGLCVRDLDKLFSFEKKINPIYTRVFNSAGNIGTGIKNSKLILILAMNKFTSFFFTFLIFTFFSCSRSAVYSTSLNIPTETLTKKEFDIQVGGELLPETRSEEIQGFNPTTFGINGQFTYGFTNWLNVGLKGWVDAESREFQTRSGFSLNFQIIKKVSEHKKIIFLPRLGVAYNRGWVSGTGFGLSGIYHHRVKEHFSFYGGVGLGWGYQQLGKRTTVENEERYPMGFGVLGNFGIAWEFAKNLRLNFEANPLVQFNVFDQREQLMIAPQIGVGYTFRKNNK